jgi:hypothetical protein
LAVDFLPEDFFLGAAFFFDVFFFGANFLPRAFVFTFFFLVFLVAIRGVYHFLSPVFTPATLWPLRRA